MNQITNYDAACQAVALCMEVDEVKHWIDKAAAMKEYARQAKDRNMEAHAAEVRIRAERQLGILLAAERQAGDLSSGPIPKENNWSSSTTNTRESLAERGISKDLSSRAQKLAAVPQEQFDGELKELGERNRQEGARVKSKLEAIGEKIMERDKPDIDPTQYYGPSDEELDGLMAEAEADTEKLRDLMNGDDPLGKALAEVKRQSLEIRTLKFARDEYQNKYGEVLKMFKAARNKLRKLEGK